MKNETYNGWHNYETWLVKLWMDNEQSTIELYTQIASDFLDNSEADKFFTKEERAILVLTEEIKIRHEELNPLEDTATVFTDLMRSALSQVNWREIAKHLIDDVISEREYQKEKATK